MKPPTWTGKPTAVNLALAVWLTAFAPLASACGGEVTDLDAANCVGQVCRVEGLVTNVSISNNTIVLAFGKPVPDQTFTAVIDANAGLHFDDVQTYVGQYARVTGLVKMNNGRPEVVLSHPSQLASGM